MALSSFGKSSLIECFPPVPGLTSSHNTEFAHGCVAQPHSVAWGGVGRLFAFRLPLSRQLLRLGDLGRGHLLGGRITKFGRWLISVRSRQAVPLISLDNIMRHPLAIIVHDGNFRLSDSLSLICGQTEPSQGLLIVFRDSLSVKIQRPQVELRLGLSLYRGFVIPLPCLNIVLRHAS